MKLQDYKGKLHIFKDVYGALKWSYSSAKKYKGRIMLYTMLVMIHRVYELFMTTRIGSIVDMALADKVSNLMKMLFVFAGLYIVNIGLSLILGRLSAKNYNTLYRYFELKTYRKIMDASWSELTEYHSGDIMMRLSSDIRCIAGNTNNLLTTIVSNLIVIVGAGLYLFYLDFTIIIVAIIITPMVLIASRIFMGKIYLAQRKIKELESEIASYNKETFNNIQAVKAFNLGDTFYEKMEKLEEKRIEADLRSNKYSLASWTVSFAAGLLAGGICVCWLFYRVHTGVISFGSLSVMTFLAIQVGGKLKGFMNMVPSVMEFVTSAERVKKLLKLKDEDSNEILEESSVIIEKSRGMGASVCIEDMSFNYKNGYKVFEKASMKANPGEIVALVGPSGGGKTTLLRLILGIVSKSTGRIYSKIGKELLDFGKNTRAMISYVPQGNTMMAGTIKENMKLIKPDASDEEIEEALKTACIYDFVSGLPDGIEHRLGENALGFSEGQNQRLSIARALLKDAPILLLDEATSALDVVTERKILDNVIRKNPKKTVILTTHRPTVLTMCDRVYHIGSKKLCRLGERGIKELMDEF